jgi:D-alanine transaminase
MRINEDGRGEAIGGGGSVRAYFNGEILGSDQVRISMDDRGFLFGDALYEVVHAYHGNLFAWDLHIERLQEGLAALRYPPVRLEVLKAAALTLLREESAAEASVYMQISRGVQPRSHLFPAETTPPTVLLWVRPILPIAKEVVAEGVKVVTAADDRWAKVWIKTVGLLPNVMAKQMAHDRGAFDAVFVRDGMVTESTSANVFIVQDGQLRTAPLNNYILPGVTRHVVLELAQELGLEVNLRPFTVAEMMGADEVFLTGTLTEVLPVREIDGVRVRSVGIVSQRLLTAFHERTWAMPN